MGRGWERALWVLLQGQMGNRNALKCFGKAAPALRLSTLSNVAFGGHVLTSRDERTTGTQWRVCQGCVALSASLRHWTLLVSSCTRIHGQDGADTLWRGYQGGVACLHGSQLLDLAFFEGVYLPPGPNIVPPHDGDYVKAAWPVLHLSDTRLEPSRSCIYLQGKPWDSVPERSLNADNASRFKLKPKIISFGNTPVLAFLTLPRQDVSDGNTAVRRRSGLAVLE